MPKPAPEAVEPDIADEPTVTEDECRSDQADDRPPGPGGANPTATVHASAAPGPVRAAPTVTSSPAPLAESEHAVAEDLRRMSRLRRRVGTAQVPAHDEGTEVARQAGYEVMDVGDPPSLVQRYFTTLRHASGLVLGSAVAVARDRDQFPWVKGFPLFLIKIAAFFARALVKRDLRRLRIEVQLRRRLELLGPTYIKLGQVLALREDLLPPFITEELKNLLDRLPVMPFPEYLDRVAKGLGRAVARGPSPHIDPKPLGSASIGQIHPATTIEGDDVILKVVKPHIYVVLKRDARLLGFFGSFLQVFFSRYQPKKVLDEFAEYTMREVDLRREAENAEQMAMNFADVPGIRFPRIYREYSSRLVLTMERFRGVRPDTPESTALPLEVRREMVDLGALAIIRMLYQDGFFHADLHPGNMFVLDTEPDENGEIKPKIGFIDLGMVGYFDGDLRRTLLYYYFSLVTGDAENAARYLASVSQAGKKADPRGFQRAVAELCRRFYRAQKYGEVNVGQLIMESVGLAGQYRMYFPVEMVLMTKALVTFEGVGQTLLPGFDVAEVSKKHVNKLFINQFNPVALLKESFKGAPELVDLIVQGADAAVGGHPVRRVPDARRPARTRSPALGRRCCRAPAWSRA